ncbi:macrolide transport system ATP-binding/permease protein [Salimicrobium halophilum]|uniref:Macrolide transport system ATP-binding/permease protein n=2 Tax=Salimicrobium halophilum TaxID=86666 RepID=A0A1G8R2C6_9BACI|nr:macrolide transport system ATP-binding/permease protein [Salimicrobium halophilum]
MNLTDVVLEVEGEPLLTIEEVEVKNGDRIGLIGKNGSGKTTLLERMASESSRVELLSQLKEKSDGKSGGELSREYLDRLFSRKKEVLLLDEPTTHLDMENVERLEVELKNFDGALVIVSHDRAFLDSLVTEIWEIDDGKVRCFPGTFTAYEKEKHRRRLHHEKEYDKYINKKKQLTEAIQKKNEKAQRATKEPKSVESKASKPYYAKKQKKLNKTSSALEKRLEQMEKVEKVKDHPSLRMNILNEESLKGRIIIRAENLEGKIGKKILWGPKSFHVNGGDKIAVTGKNGSGKTTLLNYIMEEKGVKVSPAVKIGYFQQMLEGLDVNRTILDNVREASSQEETIVRTVLSRLGFFNEDVYKKVEVLSGGERVKTGFAKLFLDDSNVLLLDEPTNYLDIEAVEALEDLLTDYAGTVLVASHDRRFLERIATRVFHVEKEELSIFDGSFHEFMNHKERQVDPGEEERLKIETRLSEVIGRLSLEPSDELDAEFQDLLRRKRQLDR